MQKKFSFDEETIEKCFKGALHAVLVSALLGLLDYGLQLSGTIQSNNVIVMFFLSWFSGSGYNTIKEYIKGI